MHEIIEQRLPVQTGLNHRGVFGNSDVPLFPPAGTFETLGGRGAVARLVDGLYDRIEKDGVLRPAFNHDLTKERAMLKLFFEQWFGGAPVYFNAEWRLGLRATHGSVSISSGMADRWLGHFFASFADEVKDPQSATLIRPYITRLAMALVNRSSEPVTGERLRCSRSGEIDAKPFMTHLQHDDMKGLTAAASEHPHVIQKYGSMLLLVAAVRGKAKAAATFLKKGVDVNVPAILPGSEASHHGLPMLLISPLCGALAKHREPVVKVLVAHGAQYDIFTASFMGDLDAVRKLLELDPELMDANDPACDVAPVTPLLHAVSAGQMEVSQLLLERGAAVGPNSVRLVRIAANAGHAALTQLLLAHGAEPALIGAGAWVMYPAIAGELLARGANVNQEPGAWIGMCCTGNSGHRENAALVQAMLQCGADVSALYKGRTALHCAAKAGFPAVVEALIEHGADVNALDDRGQTPLDEIEHATRNKEREAIRRLLSEHGKQGQLQLKARI